VSMGVDKSRHERDVAEVDRLGVRRDSDRAGRAHSGDGVVGDNYDSIAYRGSACSINQAGGLKHNGAFSYRRFRGDTALGNLRQSCDREHIDEYQCNGNKFKFVHL
jgi:hypothetical protein